MKLPKFGAATLILICLIGLLTFITYAQISSLQKDLNASKEARAVLTDDVNELRSKLRDICTNETIEDPTQCLVSLNPEIDASTSGGTDGDDGATGPRGATGPAGLTGPRGPDGPPGPQGPQGPRGRDGEDGANGTNGASGANGLDGANGADGAQGTTGAQGEIGPQGPAGPPGPAGNEGPQGPQGQEGPAGPPGAPGWTCPGGGDPQPFTFYAYAENNPLSPLQQFTAYTC